MRRYDFIYLNYKNTTSQSALKVDSCLVRNCLLEKIPIFLVNLIVNHRLMKKKVFKTIAAINKLILPSYSKRKLDITKASKTQLAIIGWRAYVTQNSLD